MQFGLQVYSEDPQAKLVEKVAAVSQKSGRNLGTTCCFGRKPECNLFFQLLLSLLLIQQTVTAELKEDWAACAIKQFCIGPGGAKNLRSFPPLFSAVFIQEDSWHLFCKTPPRFVTPFIGLSWSGGRCKKGSRNVNQ